MIEMAFERTADVYDLVYSWKDYEAEADRLHALLGRDGVTLLDVACGTGRHMQLLSRWYRCQGVDLNPEMVAIARGRGLAVHQGDMESFDLGRRFDIVLCLFSSIGYATNLDAAVSTLARHLAPGGTLVVEPWLTPESVVPGPPRVRATEQEGVAVARMSVLSVEGRTSRLQFHYLLGQHGRVEYLQEEHRLTLWSHDEHIAAFERAGLVMAHDPDGLMGRGLYTGSFAPG
jgi:SAM-dependent methyltransferase